MRVTIVGVRCDYEELKDQLQILLRHFDAAHYANPRGRPTYLCKSFEKLLCGLPLCRCLRASSSDCDGEFYVARLKVVARAVHWTDDDNRTWTNVLPVGIGQFKVQINYFFDCYIKCYLHYELVLQKL